MSVPSEGYRVHISQFEGPLDLLLYLIEKAEVDIRDIYVSEITSEFLAYLSQLDELDMEQASSFITVAATLVYMKSRSLMPRPKAEGDLAPEEDDGEALIRRLREYKAFKEVSRTLRELSAEASLSHSRLPEEFPVPPAEIILKDTDVDGLYSAFLTALKRLPHDEEVQTSHSVAADRYTIRSCAGKVRSALRAGGGSVSFLELVRDAERMELIVTFMALLEMLRRGEVKLAQHRLYGDISIVEAQLLNDDDVDYDDEVNNG